MQKARNIINATGFFNVVGDRRSEKATALCLSSLFIEPRSEVLLNEKIRLTLRAKRIIQMWSVIEDSNL